MLPSSRVDRITGIIGDHTMAVCLLTIARYQLRITGEECEQRMMARCTTTVTALLAVLHADGPP